MDILKKMITICLLWLTISAHSQEFETQLKAFELSYTAENYGNYSEAIKAMKDVYREDNYEMNLRMGWLSYSTLQYAEACNFYQKSIQLRPLSVEARLGFVNAATALGNWSQVEAQYLEILKTNPTITTVNYRMGLICYNRLDYSAALKYFNVTLNQYPFDYDTAIMVAWTEFYLGKLREAKIMFQKVLFMKPNDTSALQGLSLIK